MTISKKLGVYYLLCYGKNKLIDKFFDENVIIRYKQLIFDEDSPDVRWSIISNKMNIPFFVYQQTYDTNLLIERVFIPKHPVKIDQIPNDTPQILHLPFKFSEKERFQIAEFCKSSFYFAYTSIDGIKNYLPMPLTNGESAFFHKNEEKIEYIPLDEAFEKHSVVLDNNAVEYTINGKRGYFLGREDKIYYRIGSDNPVRITEKDNVEIFNAPIKKV